MRTHELKSWKEPFTDILDGKKRHDFRCNSDHDLRTGDTVLLKEFSPDDDAYTGREVLVGITYMVRGEDSPEEWGIPRNYCIFEFEVLWNKLV